MCSTRVSECRRDGAFGDVCVSGCYVGIGMPASDHVSSLDTEATTDIVRGMIAPRWEEEETLIQKRLYT